MTDSAAKVALVTGGSRGIGAAVARRLAADGADVALTYRADDAGAESVVAELTASGRRSIALRADSADAVAVEGAVDCTVAELGRLDIVVNNAAAFRVGPLDELDAEQFDQLMAANVRGPFLAARAAARHLGEGGRIITIGSNMVGRTPFPGFALYSMSKTALVGLTKGLARDLGERSITANLVNPGPIDTTMNPADGPLAPTIAGLTALGRYGQPDEIAAMVSYLASPAAAYVTGAVIDVDGGFTV